MARTQSTGRKPAQVSGPVLKVLGVCALALTTANCSNSPQKFATTASLPASGGGGGIDPKYGVKASPRLYAEGEAIPKGGGRRFSGKPYIVAGKTYVPREDARGYVREGLASWYGSAFHGRMTANGEVFDRHSIAAAHPTMPLPSYARVTNLKNGYSMVVRVNDRGPYHANRVMDVSEEVARALEFHRKGTERVRVEYVGKASTAGSDDRKLMASLRTDGLPAATGGPIMVADLGPEAAVPDRFSRSSRTALAFKPASEREAQGETAIEAAPEPAQRPRRPAPVMMASAASVPVPSALQPTTPRAATFRPHLNAEPRSEPSRALAPTRLAPINLAPPPIRLASLELDRRSPPASAPITARDPRPAIGKPKDAASDEAGQGPAKKAAGAKPGADSAIARKDEPKKSGKPAPAETAPATRVASKGSAPAPASPAMSSDAKLTMARLAAASAGPAAKPGSAPRRAHLAGVN